MHDDGPAVKWYRDCIHEKQRRASVLTIEVGLDAQDKVDPGALAETMKCLDTAIEVLEQAQAIAQAASGTDDMAPSQPQQLMEDLGHSMAPLEVAEPLNSIPAPGSDATRVRDLTPHLQDLRSPAADHALRFFV
ncbi:MAG: hypothetical protein WD472_02890 [Dehalococcoidia bacterium]